MANLVLGDGGWDVPGQSPEGPIALRIVLGTRLRRLREASGITREAAGYAIRASHAKITRLELGRVGFKARDVADLLTLYGVTDDQERESFLALSRRANTPGLVADPDLGERLCACVVQRPGTAPLTLPELTAFLEGERGLERKKLPELLLALPELPLGLTGKVCRQTLTRLAAGFPAL